MSSSKPANQVRHRRSLQGLTQAELAERAGISRTAVSAIEGERLVPSVAAALALSEVLGCTVEELFGRGVTPAPQVWASELPTPDRFWSAEVGGRTVLYPATTAPLLTPLPDSNAEENPKGARQETETLVLAGCDPAAGLLATQFAMMTGLRLLVLPRSSQQSLEMLRAGLVHLAGLHFSTPDEPDRNEQVVHSTLGAGFQLLRVARWQEGIVSLPGTNLRSVKAATRAKLTWIGREAGSGARHCLDQLLEGRPAPRHLARNHRGVAEAIQSGWGDAGVCVQLVSAEARLDFLAVREEAYDLCFPKSLADDRRFKAFLSVVRSPGYRRLLDQLPGYNSAETGNVWGVEPPG